MSENIIDDPDVAKRDDSGSFCGVLDMTESIVGLGLSRGMPAPLTIV